MRDLKSRRERQGHPEIQERRDLQVRKVPQGRAAASSQG